MSQEQTFRTILIVGFVVLLPIAIYHRIKSQATGEKLDRRQEGLFILATLRPAGLLLWVGIFAYMIDPSSMSWSSLPLPDWLRWMGAGLLAIAVLSFLWTFRVLGPNLTDTVVTRRAHTLVRDGPYRYVRHPFYASGFLLFLASSLVAANWFLLAGGALIFILCIIRTRTEEKNLMARFGDDYRAYMKQTGRFWPRMRANL